MSRIVKGHSKKFWAITSLTILTVGFVCYRYVAKNSDTQIVERGQTNETINQDGTSAQNDKDTSDDGNNNTSSNQITPPVAFAISKVYFSQAPKVPAEAEFGKCNLDQSVTYVAKAEVTATAAGTMTYHWEVADHLGGTIAKYDASKLDFAKAGTKTAESTFIYKVRDTGNGSNLFNRQYLNVFVTAPNEMYANKSNPVYAYKNSIDPFFVWGTYIDLC